MAGRKNITPHALTVAIRRHGRNFSGIARALGTSRQNVHQRISGSASLRALVAETEEEWLDLAEAAIIAKLKEGDPVVTRWYLEKKGRSRGWGRQAPSTVNEIQIEAIVLSLGGDVCKLREALRRLGA